MKKLLLLIIISAIGLKSHAQVTNELIIEQLEKMAESSGEENNDYSELLETYWSLIDNPININSDDIDYLSEYKLISIFQLENIKNYRKQYGDFQIVEELYEVEDMDTKTVDLLKPIVCVQKNEEYDKIKLGNVFKYGKHKLLFEVNQCLNKKEGYKDIDDSLLYENPNSIYLGSPQKLYLRYNFNYKNKVEAGFVLEKDPGEYIFRNRINDSIRSLLGNRCYTGFDFFSFHLYLTDFGLIKTLAIGDYKLSFGQGLTMGSGLSFVSKGGSLLRRGKKISASKSANEGLYLRGISSTLKYKDFELSVFYSYKNTDANVISYDSLSEEPLKITSLQQSGLHRTYNEFIDRRVINQQLYGCNISYRKSNYQIGYTIHKTYLSAELSPENTLYNLFYFRGKSLVNHGVDFYYILKKAAFYGEVAMSDNKAFAGLIGSTVQVTGYIDFTVLYRNYAKDYQCLYSNAFASGSNTRNEEGWHFGSSMSLAPNWRMVTSFDIYKSDWFKNTSHAPSQAYEFDIQLNYQPKSNTLIFIEYRNKNKMKNTSNTDIFHRYLVHDKSNMIRFHATYMIGKNFTLKNRAEFHFFEEEEEKSKSYLIYQDIIYNSDNEMFNLAFRYELFNAEKGSVYAYENDVLYAFAVGGLSNKGKRIYLVGKLKLWERFQLSGKIACTFYDNINEIGSGLERIEGNRKIDAKLQFIITL